MVRQAHHEGTFAWINQFRRLVIRYERHADLYRAFLVLAAAIICFRVLQRFYGMGRPFGQPR